VTSNRRAERAAAKRRKARRGALIAIVCSVVVIGGLTALVLTSPGWPDIRDTFFSWSEFKQTFPDIAKAFWLDIRVFMIAEVIVLILGLLIAVVRTSRDAAFFPFRLLATAYVDLFRGIPLFLLIYLVGFGVPSVVDTRIDPIYLGSAAVILSYAAYVAEVYRAGMNSVHRGQRDAGLAVGLTEQQTLRHVIVPQAVRNVTAPLLNDFISLQKDVALIAILGPAGEAARQAQIAASSDFNYTPIVGAALLYLLITIPLARVVDRMGGGWNVR
jgi:polar amino acid transport system permease protein